MSFNSEITRLQEEARKADLEVKEAKAKRDADPSEENQKLVKRALRKQAVAHSNLQLY
jgi:hypothetical protein